MITIFEKYNNNKLNEKINKYYNDDSETIIEILDTYEKKSDAKNILEKISFIIESAGDVETIKNKIYYISMKDKKKRTFIFDIKKEEFYLKSVDKYLSTNESYDKPSELVILYDNNNNTIFEFEREYNSKKFRGGVYIDHDYYDHDYDYEYNMLLDLNDSYEISNAYFTTQELYDLLMEIYKNYGVFVWLGEGWDMFIDKHLPEKLEEYNKLKEQIKIEREKYRIRTKYKI